MKRFLVLLLVLAGGLAAASFSVPTNAAVVNGQAISQDQLTSDVSAIANNPEYSCFLNADNELSGQGSTPPLPSATGAGTLSSNGPQTTSSSGFVAFYLERLISQDIILQVAAQHHVTVTAKDLQQARTAYENQISSILSEASSSGISCGATKGSDVLKTMPASFLHEISNYEAVLNALALKLGGNQRAYFDTHRSLFDTVCLTIASYTTASDAQAERAAVYEGAKFAATGGQSEGCEVLSTVVGQLPASANLQSLPLNTLSNPISYNGQYLLIEITSRSPTPYVTAKNEVTQVVGQLGASTAESLFSRASRTATVSINARYGTWKGNQGMVLPLAPPPRDVCNATANTPGATAATSATLSSSTCDK